MARNECLWLKINPIHTLSENLESCKSFQPNSFSGNAIKTSPLQSSQVWYFVAGTSFVLWGPWASLAWGCSVLNPWEDLFRVPPCMHCVHLLEPETKKQPLVTPFVQEIKGPWKEGQRVQGQEVRVPETWRSPKRNRKQNF